MKYTWVVDEWQCKCEGINPIVTGQCWLCGQSGQWKRDISIEVDENGSPRKY